MITAILLTVLVIGLTVLSVWLFLNYSDQKDNVDSKVNSAVLIAKKAQYDEDKVKFDEREKEPNREFVGPADYGRVTFDYPKTWSVYINDDANKGGNYEAYLNPVTVPTVRTSQQFATRVIIEEKDYDKAVSGYDSLV